MAVPCFEPNVQRVGYRVVAEMGTYSYGLALTVSREACFLLGLQARPVPCRCDSIVHARRL